MSPACSALIVSSSLRRGPATSWASLRPLARTGACGTPAEVVDLVVVTAGAAAGALVVHAVRLSKNRLASTRERLTLLDRSRPRTRTQPASTSRATWAMVVGQVGYTPTASTEARKLALPSGSTPA